MAWITDDVAGVGAGGVVLVCTVAGACESESMFKRNTCDISQETSATWTLNTITRVFWWFVSVLWT